MREEHHEFCNVTVPACRTEAGYCDCNGNGLFEPDNGETGWDCINATFLEWYQKNPDYDSKNVPVKYRLALSGVDCADYCPEVCQFQFMSGNVGCNASHVSYELHGNPMGEIRETGQWKYYMELKWNQTIPTWTHVHMNNNDCQIRVGLGEGQMTDVLTGAGCHAIQIYQQPTVVQSKEQCLSYKHTAQDSTIHGSQQNTMAGGTHHGGR